MLRFIFLSIIYSVLLLNPFNMVRAQSPDIATTMAWSPDGTQYAIGYVSGVIHIRDAETREVVAELRRHSSYIVAIAWSSNGDRLVSSAYEDNVLVWSVEDEKVIQEIIVEDAGSAIYALAWSPGDNEILGGASERLTFQIWNVETGERLEAFSHLGAVGQINFSPDESQLALTNILEIKIIDAEKLEVMQVLKPSEIEQGQDFSSVVWSSSNNHLASGSLDGSIRLWDTESGDMIWEVSTDNEESTFIYDLVFDTDGEHLFTLNRKGIIQVWETSTSDLLLELNIAVETRLFLGQIGPTMTNLAYLEEGGGLVVVETSKLITDQIRLKIDECVPNVELQTSLIAHLEDDSTTAFITEIEGQRDEIDEICATELIAMAEALQDTPEP